MYLSVCKRSGQWLSYEASPSPAKVYRKFDFLKIYDDEEFSVFRASPFEFSACFRAVAALPRNFLWLDMTRRAGWFDLSSFPRRVISVGGSSAAPIE